MHLELADGPIHVAVTGPLAAPVIVLIHGSMDRSGGMLRLSRRLDDRFRVLRYDRRGYGSSRPHDGPFHVAAQVDDLAAVLHGTGAAGGVWLFGHSYGGNVALAAAERMGERVLGVVVYETPMPWSDWWPGLGATTDFGRGDPGDVAERFMRRLIGDERWERLPARTRRARREEGPALVGESESLRRREPWRAAAIRCPVMALAGSDGRPHHRRSGAVISEAIDGAEYAEVDGARHFGPNTHAEDVAARVTAFATRGGRARIER